MRVVLLGAPGAGKGTQAQKICETNDIPLVVTGDIFRNAIAGQTEIGKEIEQYVKQGKLVPDELVIKVVMSRIQKDDCRDGFLLDGFPRTYEQAVAIDRQMDATNLAIDCALYFAVPREIVVERICERRTCKKCNAIFHLKYHAPKQENTCDKCGSELFHRPDDIPEVIEERLKAYHYAIEPVLRYYQQKKILHEINANRPVAEVLQDTLNLLKLN